MIALKKLEKLKLLIIFVEKIINNNIPKPSALTCTCCSKTSSALKGNFLEPSLVYICKADTTNIIENQPLLYWLNRKYI